MREVTNLAWPASPYSSAHRPIARPTRLLTGLSISRNAWAAVHLPVHRTRTPNAAAARLGVHAVQLDPGDDPAGWQVLDRLLLAARRRAVAIAGLNLHAGLDHARTSLADAGTHHPGLGALLPEWPTPTPAAPGAGADRAQLLELAQADLPAQAAATLTRYHQPLDQPSHQPVDPDPGPELLPSLVTAAATVALTAATWTDRYTLGDDPPLTVLLDDTIGDQLVFDRSGADAPAEDTGSLR